MIDIFYDVNSEARVDSAGGNSIADLKLKYQATPTWRVNFLKVDKAAGTATPLDVSAAVAWSAAVDDDFNHTSEPMCRTLDADIDASQAADGIISVPLDANTSTFEAAIASNEKKRDVFFELRGFDAESQEIFSALIKIVAVNTIDPLGGDPPDPVGNFYTKFEVDAIAAGKAGIAGAVDIEITDASSGVILKDRTTSTRYRIFFDNGILSYESIA